MYVPCSGNSLSLNTTEIKTTSLRRGRVPQCLSHRPNWVRPPPLPQASVPPPPPEQKGGGGNTRLRGEGRRTQFGRLERKPSTLSTLWAYIYLYKGYVKGAQV
jgi:hypothetical protein